jgi:transcriptional regulator with XRE-family HTH domain
MKTGEKIRFLRTMKGYSQENMADMVGISRQAYGEIERGNTSPSPERVAQIAEKLGVSPNDIEAFGNTVSNFFDQCSSPNASVNTGNNGSNYTNYNYDQQTLQHQIEKLELQLKLSEAEKQKAEIEVKYWKEKKEQ